MPRLRIILLALAACLASAPSALAASGSSAVIADCNAHGKLTRTYTVKALRTALQTMPADVKEYTNCSDVIQQALLAQLSGSKGGGSGGAGSSGGSSVPTWLIVVLVLLALSALTLGAVAVRRRGANT